jgi:hypothetical protein
MRSSVMVAAAVVFGACASQSAGRPDATQGGGGGAPAANAPAARPERVKCERDWDCEGAAVCYEGYCRR